MVEEEIGINTVTVDIVVGESKTVEANMMVAVETADMMGDDMVVEGEGEATTVKITNVKKPINFTWGSELFQAVHFCEHGYTTTYTMIVPGEKSRKSWKNYDQCKISTFKKTGI